MSISPTDNQGGVFTLRDFLFIVFSKKHVLLGVLALTIVVAMAVALLASPVYEVSSEVLIKPRLDDALQTVADRGVARTSPVQPEDINSEIAIFYTDTLLRQVVKDLKLYETNPNWVTRARLAIKDFMIEIGLSDKEDPVDKAIETLREDLEVEAVTGSNVIRVTLSGEDPQKVAATVNSLVAAFIDRHIKVYREEGSLKFFQQQAALYFQRYQESIDRLKEFQTKWNIVDVTAQKNANVELVKNLKAEHTKALVPLLTERDKTAVLYPEGSPERKDIEERIKRVRQTFESQIQQIEAQSAGLSEKELTLKKLKLEVAQNEKNYLLYQDKTEEARIVEQRDQNRVANVSVASKAPIPTVPVFPRKFLLLVMAVAVGAFVGLCGAFMAFYMDHTVKTPQYLARQTGLPVLATIDEFQASGKRG